MRPTSPVLYRAGHGDPPLNESGKKTLGWHGLRGIQINLAQRASSTNQESPGVFHLAHRCRLFHRRCKDVHMSFGRTDWEARRFGPLFRDPSVVEVATTVHYVGP